MYFQKKILYKWSDIDKTTFIHSEWDILKWSGRAERAEDFRPVAYVPKCPWAMTQSPKLQRVSDKWGLKSMSARR